MKIFNAVCFFTLGFITACLLMSHDSLSDKMEDMVRDGFESYE